MPDEREGWEPANTPDWMESDPVARGPGRDEPRDDVSFRIAGAMLEALLRLPRPLRRQSWREREIFAALLGMRVDYTRLPGLTWLGVGMRTVAGRRQLAAIVSVETHLPADVDAFRASLDIPATIEVGTRVPGADPRAPVVLEQTRPPFRYGVVDPARWLLISPMGAGLPPLQSGDRIAGQNALGWRTSGTLTAIVSRRTDCEPLLLAPEHVLGQAGNDVVVFQPEGRKFARVVDADARIDAAIAGKIGEFNLDYRVKAAGIVPAAPVPAVADMPVQTFGAVSLYQQGRIDQSMRVPAGAGRIGLLFPFTALLPAVQGDSGALIVSGSGTRSGLPLGPGVSEPVELEAAMLGMLIAGPADAVPGQVSEIVAVPMIEVLERFDVQVWVRP